jgi:hypothetical protein
MGRGDVAVAACSIGSPQPVLDARIRPEQEEEEEQCGASILAALNLRV